MGIMDTVRKTVRGRSVKVAGAVDSAVDKVDQRTKGKYSEKLHSGARQVKDTVSKLDPDAYRPDTIDGPAARNAPSGQTAAGDSSDRGPATNTPPPSGSGAGPDADAPTTGRAGDEDRRGNLPLR